MSPDPIDHLARLMHETARAYRDSLGIDLGPRLLRAWEEVPSATRKEYRAVVRAILADLEDRFGCAVPHFVEAKPC